MSQGSRAKPILLGLCGSSRDLPVEHNRLPNTVTQKAVAERMATTLLADVAIGCIADRLAARVFCFREDEAGYCCNEREHCNCRGDDGDGFALSSLARFCFAGIRLRGLGGCSALRAETASVFEGISTLGTVLRHQGIS